jgi:hypothetical protein
VKTVTGMAAITGIDKQNPTHMQLGRPLSPLTSHT